MERVGFFLSCSTFLDLNLILFESKLNGFFPAVTYRLLSSILKVKPMTAHSLCFLSFAMIKILNKSNFREKRLF